MIEPDRPATDGGYSDADLTLALILRILALVRHTDLPFTHTESSLPKPPADERDAPQDPLAPDHPTPDGPHHGYAGPQLETWTADSTEQPVRLLIDDPMT